MDEDVIGLIPAAGKGMRLGLPYPKELYPIIRNNHFKPIAQYVLDNMTTAGLQHVVFVVNETKHQLIGYFGSGRRFGCDVSYVVQERTDALNKSTSPGLAHALDAAFHLTRGKTVFFGMADTIMQPGDVFAKAIQSAEPHDDVILILFKTERPEKFGMVKLDHNSRVLGIVDKPAHTDLEKMWGCIIWRPRFTEHIHECVHRRGISDFAWIMNSAISKGMNFRGFHVAAGVYIDLGTYEEIMELDKRYRAED
ncbi:MAG: NTP transferase domain-containing protein [Anaerolineae bacterium]|nr:MAG: NTP transferase domain-containing protein [Anaerolineae bacterium]